MGLSNTQSNKNSGPLVQLTYNVVFRLVELDRLKIETRKKERINHEKNGQNDPFLTRASPSPSVGGVTEVVIKLSRDMERSIVDIFLLDM